MTASFADNEIWHVMIADDMKRMNVEQLDDAFRLSLVDASTLVWKAGMKTWQRLGAVAGLDDDDDDEPVTIVAYSAPPPPPRPLSRPVPKPPTPSRAQPVFQAVATPAFAAPSPRAPVYAAPLLAPDPYVLPKRRAAIPSEVDFRRRSGGVRVGRWLVGLLLLTAGVLGAYRQNLLREGARRLGLENKYLYGERRATEFVNAKAPAPLKLALTRLALLPGPNASASPFGLKAPPAAATPVAPVAPVAEAPLAAQSAKAPEPSEPEVKTVSLDSLPVLTPASEPEKPAPAANVAAAASKPRSSAIQAEPAAPKAPPKASAHPTPAAAVEKAAKKPKAEPVQKAEPKPKAPPAPAPANDNPLKAAIRQAIAADAGKK